MPPDLSKEDEQEYQAVCDDLGPIYGSQWRNFNGDGYDQLQMLLVSLEANPNSRRMVVSAWNPNDLCRQALPPCHVLWQVVVTGDVMDLVWFQRSADAFLGLPFDIASFGLLLSLLAQQFGYKAGRLVASFGDMHLYNNHLEQAAFLVERPTKELPKLQINDSFKDLLSFESKTDVELIGYDPAPNIKAEVSV